MSKPDHDAILILGVIITFCILAAAFLAREAYIHWNELVAFVSFEGFLIVAFFVVSYVVGYGAHYVHRRTKGWFE